MDKNNQMVGMVGYSNGQFCGGPKRMKPGWSSDPNQNGRCDFSATNPGYGNGSWGGSNNQSPNGLNDGSMKPSEPRFIGRPMKKLKIDEPKWKYLNEHRKMCGPYSLRQLMDGLKAGFLQGSLPIHGIEDGKLGKPVALKNLVEGVGGCSGAPHISQEKVSVKVQGATNPGIVREAPITSSSSCRSQQTSLSTPPSSSVTTQYYPPSSVQVRLRHITMRLVINFFMVWFTLLLHCDKLLCDVCLIHLCCVAVCRLLNMFLLLKQLLMLVIFHLDFVSLLME
jgi:hypothetical protein